MTLEEAIRLLDPKTSGEAIAEIEYYNGFRGKVAAMQAITDACEIAVEAMRKQLPVKPTIYGDGCDDNGVTIPLVKVGDTVYQTDNAGDIYESQVTQVVYGTKGIAFDERAIGKSVFLTREEAEKACGLRGTKYEVS